MVYRRKNSACLLVEVLPVPIEGNQTDVSDSGGVKPAHLIVP